MSENEDKSFFENISSKLDENIGSVCQSLSKYKTDIQNELNLFNENINSKIVQLYDIIEERQKTIEDLKTELSKHQFEEKNFNNVSIIKTQDKEISNLKSQLNILERKYSILEKKYKGLEELSNKEVNISDNFTNTEEVFPEQEPAVEPTPEPTPEPTTQKTQSSKKQSKPKKEKKPAKEKKEKKPPKEKKEKKARKTKKEKTPEPEPEPEKAEVSNLSEEEKAVIEKVANDTVVEHAQFVADKEEPIDKILIDELDVIEHEEKDYYLSKKNYVYEIANDEGDIGTRIGSYKEECVHFF